MATASFCTEASGLAALAENGHCVLAGALPREEVEAAAAPLRAYVAERRQGWRSFERAMGASATEPVYILAEAPAQVRALVCSPVLGRIAAQALGVPAVRVLHFNGFYKPGGGIPTPWHQDMAYIPIDGDTVVTLWLPLVPLTPDMGPLIFASGSHRRGEELDSATMATGFPTAVNPPMVPGDVSIHHAWTAHRSAPNQSGRVREALAISYFPDGARVGAAANGPAMMASLAAHAFAGLAPGALACGPAVPLVYSVPSDAEPSRMPS